MMTEERKYKMIRIYNCYQNKGVNLNQKLKTLVGKVNKVRQNQSDKLFLWIINKPEIHSEPKPRGKRTKRHNKWQIVMQFSLQCTYATKFATDLDKYAVKLTKYLQQNLQLPCNKICNELAENS